MALDQQRVPLPYDELTAHRHLLVSERLRARRRELGLTQKEVVARLRRLGVTTTNKSLSSLEHGAGLDVCKLPEIARALDCTLTYLVGLTDAPTAWAPDGPLWEASGEPLDGSVEAHEPRAATPVVRSLRPPIPPIPPILGPLA